MKWILGTATFGSDYGIANRSHFLSEDNSKQILAKAQRSGISYLDTAPGYALAEGIIGKYHLDGGQFNIYSKIPKIDTFHSESVLNSIETSISRMNVEKLEGVLFHSPESLINNPVEIVRKTLALILESKLVKKIGVSVYTENDIVIINERFPEINIFQVPENILDRRLINSKKIKDMFTKGYEFHIRSVFLQGLLLMDIEKIPVEFSNIRGPIELLQIKSNIAGCSLVDMCLSYVTQIEWMSGIIVGVITAKQLDEIVNFTNVKIDLEKLPILADNQIKDPRNWK